MYDAFMWFIHATLVILFFLLHLHSLNIRRMKLSSLELQTFPYFWKFHAILELYLMSRPDQGIHPLLEIQNCSKWKHFEKSIFEFSYFKNMEQLDNFIKPKPLICEECVCICFKNMDIVCLANPHGCKKTSLPYLCTPINKS